MNNRTNHLLDETFDRLQGEEPVDVPLTGLVEGLYNHRTAIAPADWHEWAHSGLRRHRLYPVLLEDPFVRHAAVRPRGYPGDAELLDYIYGSGNVLPMIEGASPIGRRLYQWDRDTPACSAVRHRLKMAATEVDRLARMGTRPHVLSIACGHLREAQHLESLPAGMLGRFAGLDQDKLSLDLVRREWGKLGVEARECDARMLIRNGIAGLGKFDFVYSLGLFDYLSDVSARRLVAMTVDMLHPGGKAWIANFVEDLWSAGYMEAVMDWWLVYRSEDRLNSLAQAVPPAKIAMVRTFREPERNVAVLEITRA